MHTIEIHHMLIGLLPVRKGAYWDNLGYHGER